MSFTDGVKNVPRLPNGGGNLTGFLTTGIDPSHSFRMTFNVLCKDHGVGRQKELLAHAVRLRMLACRNDLNRKRIVSLQLTADSFYLLTDLPTTGIDPSRLFRMTFNVLCHYDA